MSTGPQPYMAEDKQQPPASSRKNLDIPENARVIHKQLVTLINELLQSNTVSPLAPNFVTAFGKILEIFGHYQHEVIRHSPYRIKCSPGCAHCCNHWVEDVYFFEAQIIADYIRRNLPSQRIAAIIAAFQSDVLEIQRLDTIVAHKLTAMGDNAGVRAIDPVDLLLASFFQLNRPCALLNEDGTCAVYPVRPITCRIYVSFSDPRFCGPRHTGGTHLRTYLLDFEEEASELLDQLHLRFDKANNDLGLRSILLKLLENNL